ncbi:MAG: alpha-N-arabinofuranosidase [Candidatus Dormibacteraeota bacterium]|nr:alpha-N-arabinofuranosidase [Candidatus Dormibacteraeota bacterium]
MAAAVVRIDPRRTLGSIDRRIFGGFIEHLGRCIYGGVYDPESRLADDRGFRTDVLEAARGLAPPVLRWPGGNFVSGYHWTDGVGPATERPRRWDRAWHAEEPNTFGTDEFMAYCQALGTEPYLCLNMGTGTIEEACAWVEYCNGTGDTHWAAARRRNGHAEPYGVRYWGLGNEMYGEWQLGSLSADEYVREARRWAAALRRTDPSIELISCGRDGLSDWDRVVVDGLIRHVDHHSIHLYTGSDDYWSNVLAPVWAERALRVCGALIERARHLQRVERPVRIAYDEWNVWFRERAERSGLEERYTLSDALAVQTFLNVFVRQCRVLSMANLAQLVNVIAPIVTGPDGLFLQTIYHPLRLASTLTREVALDPHVDCATVEYTDPETGPRPHRIGDLGPFGILDVAASRDAGGRHLTVAIVNRALEGVRTSIELEGELHGEVLTHRVGNDDVAARNDFAAPDRVAVRTSRRAAPGGRRLELDLEPHSITYVEASLG